MLEDETAFWGHRRAAPSLGPGTSASVRPPPPGGTPGRACGDARRRGIGLKSQFMVFMKCFLLFNTAIAF